MKKILLSILLIVASTFLNAQIKDFNKSEILETVLNKKQLHSNAKDWIAKTFKDYKSVLQYEDEDKIIIKGISKIQDAKLYEKYIGFNSYLDYTLIIEAKDLKYRFMFENINFIEEFDFRGLGRNIMYNPVSLNSQIEKHNKYVDEITQNNKAISESNNKSEIKKITKENITLKKKQDDLLYLINIEIDVLNNLSNSLKKSMIINNEW